MTNLLNKTTARQSVWVPPVYRTQLQAVYEEVSTPVGGKRTEYRLSVYDALGLELNSAQYAANGASYSRVIGSNRETYTFVQISKTDWSQLDPRTGKAPVTIWRGWKVEIESVAVQIGQTVRYEQVQVLLTPGYWQTSREADSWAAGAKSRKVVTGPVRGQFTVPVRAVGVVCGLAFAGHAVAGEDVRSKIAHGFWVQGDSLAIWNQPGAGNGRTGDMEELAPMPGWSAAAVLRVDAAGEVVTYYVDGVPVARGVSALAGLPVVLAASLLGGEDVVDQPVLESSVNQGQGAVTLQLQQRGGDTLPEARASVALHLAVSSWNAPSRTVIGALRGRGSQRGSTGNTALRLTLSSYGYGMPGGTGSGTAALHLRGQGMGYPEGSGYGQVRLNVHSYGYSDNRPPSISNSGWIDAVMSVEVLDGEGVFEQPRILSRMDASLVGGRSLRQRIAVSARHAGSRVQSLTIRERLIGKAQVMGGVLTDAIMLEALVGTARVTALMLVDVALHEVLSGHAVLDAGVLKDGLLIERIAAADGLSVEQLLTAWLLEVIGVAAPAAPLDADMSVFCVRDTGSESEASATYESYAFNSFANIGGNYFGAGEHGLYALEGDSDAGQPIEVHIDLGQRDFGSDHLKLLANAYLSTNAAQPLKLLVTMPDGKTYTYPSRGADPLKRTQRIDLGRGLRAHFYGLEIHNDEGSAFELDGLNFNLTESKRRI